MIRDTKLLFARKSLQNAYDQKDWVTVHAMVDLIGYNLVLDSEFQPWALGLPVRFLRQLHSQENDFPENGSQFMGGLSPHKETVLLNQ